MSLKLEAVLKQGREPFCYVDGVWCQEILYKGKLLNFILWEARFVLYFVATINYKSFIVTNKFMNRSTILYFK